MSVFTLFRRAKWCRIVTAMIAILGILAGGRSLSADEPVVQRILPLGVTPGQTTDVQIIGQHLTPSTRLWTSCGLSSQPAAEKSAGHFTVTVPADTPPGIHGLRVVTEQGVSRLALFLVDDLPGTLAAGGNHELASAQAVSLPAAIDGTVDNLQRHYFRFAAAAGEQTSFEVLARRLGSPLDPALFLYRENGRELAYSDDVAGLSGDCQLSHTFAEAGRYILELRDIRYAGGGGHFYRLRIGDFPCLNGPYPLTVQRGIQTRIDFAGLDVAEADPARAEVPPDWPLDWYPVSTRRTGGAASAFTTVAVTDRNQFREQEPNDTPAQANRISLGDHVNARFDHPGDADRFTFAAQKGDRFVFQGVTRQRDAPTDLVMRLFDPDGKQLARKDDDGTDEGSIDHTFAADGDYTLIAEDLHGRGGLPYAYRIEVQRYTKGFSITAAADHVNVPAGGIGQLAVNVVRRADNGTITVAAAGLPEGWTSLPTTIGPSMNTGVLTIRGPDLSPTPPQVADLTIVGTTEIGGGVMHETADLSAALRGQLNNIRSVPLNVRTSVAAAVTPAKPFSIRFDPPEVVFGPHLKTTIKVIAERGAAITEPITLATEPAKNALPRDVTLGLKPIDKGTHEVTLELFGGAKAPPGPFSVVLTASHTKDKQTDVVVSPPLSFRIDQALKIQIDAGDRNLPRGGEQKLTVKVTRNPALAGDVTLTLDKLPPGVTAEPVTLPANQNTIEVTLKGAEDAAQGQKNDIVVKATAAANDQLTVTQSIGKLTVQ